MRAFSAAGPGTFSVAHSVYAATVPDPPIDFVRESALTSTSQVSISWTAPAVNGGSSITKYVVEYDRGLGGAFFDAIEEIGAAHTRTSLTADNSYVFRVKAFNVVGASAWSTSFSIISANIPGTPTSVIRNDASTT